MSSLEFVDELIAHGARINLTLGKGPGDADGLGREGVTPFLMAARTADLPLMKRLLVHGADPHQANSRGRTPLLAASGVMLKPEADEAASEAEAIKAAAFLLAQGADINAVDANGDTVMHGAAYKQAPELVRLFAAQGADVKIWFHPNKQGRTPLRIARGFRNGNFKPSAPTEAAIIEVLTKAGIEIPPPPPPPGTKQIEE
jgi:ankyrin repeat protein